MVKLLEEIGQPEPVFLMLDYDGTLVPIAPTPHLARPTPGLLQILRGLSSLAVVQLAVISGRALNDLECLLPLDGVFLVGDHGAAIRTPTGGRLHLMNHRETQSIVRQLTVRLQTAVTGLTGCVVEGKAISLALHYRLASTSASQQAITRFTHLAEPLVREGRFEWLQGKKVLELRPVGVNKGRAVGLLLDRFLRPGAVPIYVGDDLTDEDAFGVLKGLGITILVSAVERPTLAGYRLRSPDDVGHFLQALMKR